MLYIGWIRIGECAIFQDMPAFIDLSGKRFGRWLVLTRALDRGRQIMWHCRCDCGTEKEVLRVGLVGGSSKSCGCWNREVLCSDKKHGHAHKRHRSREFNAWVAAKSRCSNPNNPSFQHYGARGIAVC